MECIFCNIVNRTIGEDLIYEGEQVVAFRDINPQAPTHILIVPREHVGSTKRIAPCWANSSWQLRPLPRKREWLPAAIAWCSTTAVPPVNS